MLVYCILVELEAVAASGGVLSETIVVTEWRQSDWKTSTQLLTKGRDDA